MSQVKKARRCLVFFAPIYKFQLHTTILGCSLSSIAYQHGAYPMNITYHGITGNLGMGLAPRELQCLLSVAAGLTSKEVARELGLSPDTVDKRLLAATTKMGVTRRAALVAEAFKRGVIAFACSMVPGEDPQHDRDTTQGVFVA